MATAELHEGPACDCEYNSRHLLIVPEGAPELTRLIAAPMAPRPGDTIIRPLTRRGVLRAEYSSKIEGHPPRFARTPLGYRANPDYFEWASRADAWADCQPAREPSERR